MFSLRSKIFYAAAAVGLAAATVVACPNAFADSYTVYPISVKNQGNVDNIGLTTDGTLVTQNASGFFPTYSTFTPPGTVTTSPTVPALTFDNGTSCTPTAAGVTQISMGRCNNGREVFQAYQGTNVRPSFFLQEANTPLQLLYAGPVGNILLNASGDVAFVGLALRDADTNFLYFDTTTRSISPEPSSFVLLATGLLGVGGRLLKRTA